MYAAAGAYLEARARLGRFLVRIEDLDRPREMPGAAESILATLRAFGFEWDGPVLRQSEHADRYAAAIETLRAAGRLYACDCSRSRLPGSGPYPGTCRGRIDPVMPPHALRVRVDPGAIGLEDRVQGIFCRDLAAVTGDFVVRRRDGIVAYVLGVVIDDAEQGVTDVVRGADLLDSTPQQIYLQSLLSLPTPRYAHLPVLTELDGGKLAKSRRSLRLDARAPVGELTRVLQLLGLAPPADLAEASIREVWDWAIARWRLSGVPRRATLALAGGLEGGAAP